MAHELRTPLTAMLLQLQRLEQHAARVDGKTGELGGPAARAVAAAQRFAAVMLAPNGREALDALRRAPILPRLILLDLMMPVMDGWQFRAEQKSRPELDKVPVALVSAHIDIRSEAARLDAVTG